jgi:hypothetical protein
VVAALLLHLVGYSPDPYADPLDALTSVLKSAILTGWSDCAGYFYFNPAADRDQFIPVHKTDILEHGVAAD